jgi:hypothetical protein
MLITEGLRLQKSCGLIPEGLSVVVVVVAVVPWAAEETTNVMSITHA